MKFKLDHILAPFGNKKTKQEKQVDDFTEKIIADIDMVPFAISDSNVIYANITELGGYFFLKTVIVGTFNIKTKKGGTLQLNGNSVNLELNSDMLEFESDHSNIPNRSITSIDFQLEEADISKIDKTQIDTLILKSKKTTIEFKILPN